MTTATTQNPYDLTVGQAAKILGVGPDTVRRWARAGRIDHWLTPGGHFRFRTSDIEACFENRHN